MILLLIPVVGLLVVVGVNFGWRWVLAPLIALVLVRWTVGSLMALVADARHAREEEAAGGAPGPSPVGPDERTLFWCEECGTELLLLVRGTSRAPSHCGQRMHERSEIAN